jgi:hypothetical protein
MKNSDKWIQVAVSKDKTRGYIARLNIRDGAEYGTDGHRLHLRPTDIVANTGGPPWKQVVPEGNGRPFPCQAARAIAAAEIAAAKELDVDAVVVFSVANGILTLRGVTTGMIRDYLFACDDCPEKAMNARYLLDSLPRGEDADLLFGGQYDPFKFSLAGGLVAIVMPRGL